MAKRFTSYGDADFDNWFANFETALLAHYSEVGLSSADSDALGAVKLVWDTKYAANNAVQIQAKEGTAGKNEARKTAEDMLSPLVTRIQTYPGTTDELRQAFGLSPRGASTSDMGLDPMDRPSPDININAHQKHEVKIRTKLASGDVKRARPEGVVGCEIRRKIGSAPAGIEDMALYGTVTKTELTIEYPMDQIGETVYYAFRWVHKSGSTSDWVVTEPATIAA